MRAPIILSLLFASLLSAQERPSSCTSCLTWNIVQPAFRLYSNTFYVGTHGLSAILITSEKGHILIDAALPESVPLIADNIRALGFKVEDIKLIVNSHVHFDHGGGLAELQRLSKARVALSPWSANVITKGIVAKDDPQYGVIIPSPKIDKAETFKDGASLTVGPLAVTAHYTPGHTPGGTSWTWQSCENTRCLNFVYADSLTAVSEDNYKYSRRKQYPHAEDFERSFKFLESISCDILVTPHPEAANLWDRVAKQSLVDSTACRVLAGSLREKLKRRLVSELP